MSGQTQTEPMLADELDRVYALVSGEEAVAASGDYVSVVSCRPLERLITQFRLSTFERDVLLLCAGAALETRFLHACARANGDDRAQWPTFAMAMTVLDGAHWSTLSRLHPLRYWRLVEEGPSPSLLQAPLKIDERILQYLLSVPSLDSVLEWLVRPLVRSEVETADQDAQRIAMHWQRETMRAAQPVVIQGNDFAAAKRIFQEACSRVDLVPFVLRATDLPTTTAEREIAARHWTREAVLTGAALLLETSSADNADAVAASLAWARSVEVPLAIYAEPGSAVERIESLPIRMSQPGREDRKQLWLESLGPPAASLNGQLDGLVDAFRFDEGTIRLAALDVVSRRSLEDSGTLAETLLQSCRDHARRPLEGLAQRIDPRAHWDDLVLPDTQKEILRELMIHVRHRRRVHQDWGFSSRYGRGMGLTSLFAGPSGTGKTMAAEILAGELGLDLYQIDLAAIVSKYIGETEKNLKRIFDAAEQSSAVLLFDEADALFGKRSEVKDSHDRYANLEVSYLLQRMEAYGGVAILTTNMQRAIDPAFLRRIRFIVQFPFPDESSRRQMWSRVFPAATPTEGLQPEKLAQLHISGAVIRNIAMHAAYLAAEDDLPVRMSHIAAGVRTEYTKMDKVLTPAETGGWA
ncbi:ATP-binding protein [Terriglobus roseus]|uniref:ATPase family associated with various cellular activities (AAA) n=1 Tax=Terriglobus roseus TaxID=392734 RepID=A0A1G7J9A2_9BACT|nr:ATP-binding protein [Terriglobus roseus]SDF21475.1 ATPase family associated with various cellular activities (AAA) [Terriglobus roseus]